jgi:hypothetical protein
MESSSIQTTVGAYLAIFISAIVFIYTLYKDRILRRKEYADRIRTSAGTIIAKLERWKSLSLRFFEDIGPLLTETDFNLAINGDFNKGRYDLWIGLEKARALSSQRIVDEQIEMAYKDLYGYDPNIEDLFVRAVNELKKIDKNTYIRLTKATQMDIIEVEDGYNSNEKKILPGLLGTRLRMVCGREGEDCDKKMKKIIDPFRKELLKLIVAKDKEIFEKEIEVSNSEEIFKTLLLDECDKVAIIRPAQFIQFGKTNKE